LAIYDAGIFRSPAVNNAGPAGRSLHPAVATLAFVKLVVNTALRFVYPFLPAIARGLGIDLTQAGVLMSVRWVSGLAAPAVLSSRGKIERSRALLVWGLVIFAAGAVVTAWTGVFVGAIVGFALLGLAKPMIEISSRVYIAERVPYQSRARYLGILEISWAGGLLIGAPLAGWLIDNWSWETPFWMVGSMAALGIGLALAYLDPNDETASGLAVKASDSPDRQVLLLLVVIGLSGFGHESLLVVLGGWLESSFGMTLIALGGVGTLIGISELIGEGAMVGFTDRIGKRNSLALGLGIAGVALLGLSLVTGNLGPALSALAISTIASEFGYISAIPLMTELRPRARTRILALFSVANAVGRIAGDLIAPRLFESAGMPGVTTMAAGAALVAALLVIVGVREVGKRDQVDLARSS